MDTPFDIFEIYRRYCDITSRELDEQCDGCSPDELQKARISREALAQLWKKVESRISQSVSILDEIQKLMSRLDLMAGAFSEFSRFYDFVFFISRENGQKNITVGRAVVAWRLVLSGRFRLLNQWCNFVEKNQRYNISEDTWRQVLAFSRCVHENLEGYDPKGAWPVLIDEFVEYMYRIRGSHPNFFCNCGDSDSEPQQGEKISSGLTNIPGSKRKLAGHLQMDAYASSSSYANSKRRFYLFGNSVNWGQDQMNCGEDDCVGKVKQSGPLECSKSPCSIEGCLSKGFAGLLSGKSCLKFDQDRRVSYT